MNLIDPRTAIVLISAMSAMMALVLYALKRSYPPSIHGLGHWSQALLVIVGGGILAASRGKLPEVLTTAVPNFLLSWGVYGSTLGPSASMECGPTRCVGWAPSELSCSQRCGSRGEIRTIPHACG